MTPLQMVSDPGYWGLILLHAIAAGLMGVVTVDLYRRFGRTLLGRGFTAMGLAGLLWTTGALGRLAAPDATWWLTATVVRTAGKDLATVAVIVVVLIYTGNRRWVTRRLLALLAVVPTVTQLAVLSNPQTGWYHDGLMTVTVGGHAVLTPTGYASYAWLQAGYNWVLLAVAVAVVGFQALTTARLYRRQVGIIVAAVTIGWSANLAYGLFGWPDPAVDPTPVAFVASGLLLAVGFYRVQLGAIAPPGAHRLLAELDVAVITTDADGRIEYCNATAAALSRTADPVGRPIGHSFPEAVATATPGQHRELRVGTDPPRDLEVSAYDRSRRDGLIIVGEDVTVRTRQRRQLEAQNTQLERLATIIAHDLRTPLSTAQKALELLQLEQPETRAQATEDLEALLAYFTAITEDLPQLARASTKLAEREACSLTATARDAWAALDPPAEITLRTPVDVTIYADRLRLRRLVGNLLENAIEHGGAVTTVTVAPTDRGFHVADDGDGLGAADPAAVFEYGVSADGGSGVGLSVVDSIAAAHGWRLDVGATEGGGTTVHVDMATAGEAMHG